MALSHRAGPIAPPHPPSPPKYNPGYLRTLICNLFTLNPDITTNTSIQADFSIGFAQQLENFLNYEIQIIFIVNVPNSISNSSGFQISIVFTIMYPPGMSSLLEIYNSMYT